MMRLSDCNSLFSGAFAQIQQSKAFFRLNRKSSTTFFSVKSKNVNDIARARAFCAVVASRPLSCLAMQHRASASLLSRLPLNANHPAPKSEPCGVVAARPFVCMWKRASAPFCCALCKGPRQCSDDEAVLRAGRTNPLHFFFWSG